MKIVIGKDTVSMFQYKDGKPHKCLKSLPKSTFRLKYPELWNQLQSYDKGTK